MAQALAPGFIRPEVALRSDAEGDCIRFSHWELRLPPGFVASHPVLGAVLAGRSPLGAATPGSPPAGVLTLLDAQGGFATFGPDESCSGTELRAAFDKLRSLWASAYYAHPLWQRLRSGVATLAELVAWVLHNYQISRVAGPVAARCATSAHPAATRQQFLGDALDEFWHAQAFYFVRHPRLKLGDEQVKASVPLPATRAFELHCLQTAERDALGHSLIAYHQESTVHFLDDCIGFYDQVEQRYQLPGFFEPWKQHMRIDREEGHCDSVAMLLDESQRVSAPQREQALRSAWLAHHYLLCALDDILAEQRWGDTPDLRPSGEAVRSTSLARAGVPVTDQQALRSDLARCLHAGALAALARADDHDGVMSTGHLLRTLNACPMLSQAWQQPLQSPWMVALCALLRERAHPRFLAHVLPLLLRQWQLRTDAYAFDPEVHAACHRLAPAVPQPGVLLPWQDDLTQAVDVLDRAFQAPLMQPVSWQA